MDAQGAIDVSARSVRRSRVVLMSRCWHQVRKRRKPFAGDGGKRAVLREEHEASRKAIAQGRPGCSRQTCMLVCSFLPSANRHAGPRVRQAPGLLCALRLEGGKFFSKPRASDVAGSRSHITPALPGPLLPARASGTTASPAAATAPASSPSIFPAHKYPSPRRARHVRLVPAAGALRS